MCVAVWCRWQEWAIFAAEQERERRILELRLIEEVGHLLHFIYLGHLYLGHLCIHYNTSDMYTCMCVYIIDTSP